jgi:hypothetical protein
MDKMKFQFNKDKDALNIWEASNSSNHPFMDFSRYVPPKLVEICKEKDLEDVKEQIEKHMEKVYASKIIDIYLKGVEKAWNNIQEEYLKRLKKITNKPLDIKDMKAYITTASRCPYRYKERWFMISLFSSIPQSLEAIGHELLHFHFHDYYFEDIVKELGGEETHNLREGLTILLDFEFNDLWFVKDRGYEKHNPLREFISKEWNKNRNFDKLLEQSINYIKENKKQ